MIKNKIIICKLFLPIIIITLTLLSLVSASLGLSQDYQNQNPLTVGPGETKEAVFGRFQNPDNESITLKIELIEGGDIVTLIDSNLDSFVIPAGNLGVPLNIRVAIPQEILEGAEYNVVVKYADITERGGTGMITMAQAMTSSMPVLVQKTETPTPDEGISPIWWILGVIALIAIIAVIWFVVRNKKN